MATSADCRWNDDFFKKDTPHGLVKRFMWKRHVQTFIAMTQRQFLSNKTIIFDGFAGAGRYGSENEWPDEIEKYGSPLISLRAAINLYGRRFERRTETNRYTFNPDRVISDLSTDISYNCDFHGFHDEKIRLFFVERNKKNYKKLVKNVITLFMKYDVEVITSKNGNEIFVKSNDENIPVGCKITNASFEDVEVPEMDWRDNMASFIDPYGYTQIPMEKIKEFTGRNKDVFINLMSQHINRFKNIRKDGLEKLFGFGYDSILERLERYEGGTIEKVAKLYIDVLEEQIGDQFHLSFEMLNKGNVPLYHMIFASSHYKRLNSMKEAMNRGTQSQDAFSLSDYLIVKKKQPLSLKNDQDDGNVADKIYEEFKGKQNVCIGDIKNFIMHKTNFVWRKTPLKILEVERRLMKCVYTNKKRRIKGTYPHRYKYTFDF